MPNFNELLAQLQRTGSPQDVLRRDYLKKLHEVTGRNIIIYYSGWLQKPDIYPRMPYEFAINDSDKSGFMATIHQLDRKMGLDLVLHTPGGGVAETESLVQYLRSMFGNDIRAIVPQIAMSGGTMIACSCKNIVMGEHSNLGPIDPQFGNFPAGGVIEEFERARREISQNPANIHLWQQIIAKYLPTFIGECQNAVVWSNQMVKDWLVSNMFAGDSNRDEKANRVVTELGSHALTLAHNRHISMASAQSMGLNVTRLEDDDELQEAVLSVHHACLLTLGGTGAVKIIENHRGIALVQGMPTIQTVLAPS